MSFAGAGLFLRNRTAIIPFKPATRLVTSGVYRWTRNPMYLGMALTYAGLAFLLNSLTALVLLLVVIAIVQRQVIAREEAYLERAFGNANRETAVRIEHLLSGVGVLDHCRVARRRRSTSRR